MSCPRTTGCHPEHTNWLIGQNGTSKYLFKYCITSRSNYQRARMLPTCAKYVGKMELESLNINSQQAQLFTSLEAPYLQYITTYSTKKAKTIQHQQVLPTCRAYFITTEVIIERNNRRNNIHRLLLGGSTGGEKKQRKAKNGVDDKHHRMDRNALRRPREACSRNNNPREACSRSGGMEDHESQPSQRRRHLMMMMNN